jgi:hypothetical protein
MVPITSEAGFPSCPRRMRMASQAWAITVQTLAVEIEPPATGAGGRSVSPSETEIFSTGMPSPSEAVCAATV